MTNNYQDTEETIARLRNRVYELESMNTTLTLAHRDERVGQYVVAIIITGLMGVVSAIAIGVMYSALINVCNQTLG
jgi:hypothetical protein